MCDVKCQKYITETKVFSQSGQTDTNANSVIFINSGTNIVNVDGLILQPSQSLSILGNRDEINIKVYSFSFTGSLISQLTVIYKRYVN
jgi:hypothetical protein